MKTKGLYIRVTEEQTSSIKKLAKEKKMTVTNLVLDSVFSERKNLERNVLFELIKDESFNYSKVSTNINQITKFVNSQSYITEQQILEFNSLLKELVLIKSKQDEKFNNISKIISKW